MTKPSRAADYVLAVDGGQSSTLALVAANSGRILGAGLAGPSNHVHEPGGMERLQSALRGSITAALENAGLRADQIGHACLGMTGAPNEARAVVQALLPHSETQAYYDTVTALAGASVAQPGVIVIAGTGAVAYGRRADGREAKAGGWGYLMGDEGSGYDIGLMALRAATQAQDGRGSPTLLLRMVPEHFGVASLEAVHAAVYAGRISRPQIAGLASVVAAAGQQGDVVAQGLLADAGRQLGQAALAVMARLGMLEAGMTVYTTGGVFRAGAALLGPFQAVIEQGSRNAVVRPAQFAPVVGALFLALQGAGMALTPGVIQAAQDTLPRSASLKHPSGVADSE